MSDAGDMLAAISQELTFGKPLKPASPSKKKSPLLVPQKRGEKPKSLAAQLREIAKLDDWTDGDWGHWHLADGLSRPAILPVGFVYCITRKSDGRFYIGQKKVTRVESRPPLKGYIKKRKFIRQTDWRTYCGSSSELLADIGKLGEEAFDFEILCFTDSKWMLSYLELWFQMNLNVMFRQDSYNGIVNVRLSKFASMAERWESFTATEPRWTPERLQSRWACGQASASRKPEGR